MGQPLLTAVAALNQLFGFQGIMGTAAVFSAFRNTLFW
jgi:hypothetical protein